MSEFILTNQKLATLVLAEIRKRRDCEGVDEIVIVETINPRSASNWEICIIVASSGDPSTVQRAGAEVQQLLQPLYRLD